MEPTDTPAAHTAQPAIASELNNLLQIIAGTSSLIENIWEGKPGAARYFEMLRESIARAADVTTDLMALSSSVHSVGTKIVLHPAWARRQEEKAAQPPSVAKQRIMLVDDEKMLLVVNGEILREAGYEVVTAQSGFECLDLFRAGGARFDLVLLDLNMPLMDGEETFHRLRELKPDLRVMLCTGYVHQERLTHMMDAGLSGFMQKPLGSQQYLERIRDVLARNIFTYGCAAARSLTAV